MLEQEAREFKDQKYEFSVGSSRRESQLSPLYAWIDQSSLGKMVVTFDLSVILRYDICANVRWHPSYRISL